MNWRRNETSCPNDSLKHTIHCNRNVQINKNNNNKCAREREARQARRRVGMKEKKKTKRWSSLIFFRSRRIESCAHTRARTRTPNNTIELSPDIGKSDWPHLITYIRIDVMMLLLLLFFFLILQENIVRKIPKWQILFCGFSIWSREMVKNQNKFM